jgi:hypothetical protein
VAIGRIAVAGRARSSSNVVDRAFSPVPIAHGPQSIQRDAPAEAVSTGGASRFSVATRANVSRT